MSQTSVYDSTGKLLSSTPFTAEAEAAQTVIANKGAIEANIISDLAAMQAIIDDSNTNINANPAQRIKDIARAIRRLDRMALQKFDGTA